MVSERTRGIRKLLSVIRHPRRIACFVLTSGFIALGSAAVVPLINVVFHEGDVHANEGEMGVVFPVGALAVATLGVPLLAARMLKVDAIVPTLAVSLSFILAMGLLPLVMGESSILMLVIGASYVGSITMFN